MDVVLAGSIFVVAHAAIEALQEIGVWPTPEARPCLVASQSAAALVVAASRA